MADAPTIQTVTGDEDYRRETYWTCGGLLDLGPALRVPPVTAGGICLLDYADSPALRGGQWTPDELLLAIYVLAEGRAAAPYILRQEHGATAEEVRAAAGPQVWLFAERLARGQADPQAIAAEIGAMMQDALAGYAMMAARYEWPDDRTHKYDTEWLSRTVVAAWDAGMPGDWDTIVWSTPLCRLGHIMVAAAIRAGQKVSRPIDTAATVAALKKLNET